MTFPDKGNELHELAEQVMGDKAREVGNEEQAAELYDIPFAADLHENDEPEIGPAEHER